MSRPTLTSPSPHISSRNYRHTVRGEELKLFAMLAGGFLSPLLLCLIVMILNRSFMI
ncbi:hypothetical protein [Larsenimonas rhizosphaerae]|uniref:Uncharacterized protein n=1 Tax=Larsenimonas rhizosphaerae TaxID=2944682 RepID=A0AA41ZK16_9GAMM|nr:hypothetical protein [Larsenimonas rhizosphaerae]MCM2130612.1 hypothetical protein [Larsenimonas rhizosphaerae]MCX2523316.1 hypothetical protein [Larsenimonas rhizosphaerae]